MIDDYDVSDWDKDDEDEENEDNVIDYIGDDTNE